MVVFSKKYLVFFGFLLTFVLIFLSSWFLIDTFFKQKVVIQNNHPDYELALDKSRFKKSLSSIFGKENISLVINITDQAQSNLIKQKIDNGEIIPIMSYSLDETDGVLYLNISLDRNNLLLTGMSQQSLDQRVEFVIDRALILYQLTSSGQIDDSDYQNISSESENVQTRAKEIYQQALDANNQGVVTINEKNN